MQASEPLRKYTRLRVVLVLASPIHAIFYGASGLINAFDFYTDTILVVVDKIREDIGFVLGHSESLGHCLSNCPKQALTQLSQPMKKAQPESVGLSFLGATG